jgi:hypothetical protein
MDFSKFWFNRETIEWITGGHPLGPRVHHPASPQSHQFRRNRPSPNGAATARSSAAHLHDPTSCGERATRKGERDTLLITSCRSNVAVPISLQICSGKRSKKRRLKTEAKETVGGNKSRDSFFSFVRFHGITAKWLHRIASHHFDVAGSLQSMTHRDCLRRDRYRQRGDALKSTTRVQ